MESKRARLMVESNSIDESGKENKEIPSSCSTPVGKTMVEYFRLTVSQLKEECRSKGLTVSGNKTVLVNRLMNPESSSKSSSGRKKSLSVQKVHKLLTEAGVKDPESKSKCLKRAIQRGFVVIDGKESLKKVITVGKCHCCDNKISGTVEQLLDQPDYAGCDYEDGGKDASLRCGEEDCSNGVYVTRMCEGQFHFDSGKFHNHCHECPGFGKCIGDYREEHCKGCNGHFFAGSAGNFPCHKCERRRGVFGGDWDDNSDDDSCTRVSNDCVLS